MINTSPLKPKCNHLTLQIYIHNYFPHAQRSTNMINWSIAIDMPGIENRTLCGIEKSEE